MSLRNYAWSKSDLKTYGSGSSGTKPSETSTNTKKYESSYSRSKAEAPTAKESTRTLPSLDKLNTTGRYSSPSSNSYRSNLSNSYSPSSSSYTRDKSNTREKDNITPTNRYGNYSTEEKSEKPSVLNKYMSGRTTDKANDISSSAYSRLSVNTSSRPRSRDPSPADKNRYSYTRNASTLNSRTLDNTADATRTSSKAAETKDKETNDKDTKTNKSTAYSSSAYPAYKHYSRPISYSRPILKEESKPEPSRYCATTNRFTSNYSRTPERPATSPCSNLSAISNGNDLTKSPILQNGLDKTNGDATDHSEPNQEDDSDEDESSESEDESSDSSDSMINITVVTRGTSPTAPSSSVYLRTRRADMAKTIEKTVSRPRKKCKMVDKEMQSDRMDDSTRSSRYGSTARISTSPWSSYSGYSGSSSNRYSSGLSGRYYNYTSSRDINTNSDKPSRTRTSESEAEAVAIKSPESTSSSSSIIPKSDISTRSAESISKSEKIEPIRTFVREKSKSPPIVSNVPVKQKTPELQIPKTMSPPVITKSIISPVVSKAMSPPVVPKAMSPPVVPKAMSPPVVSKAITPPVVSKAMSPPVMPKAMSPPVVPIAMSPPVVPKAMSPLIMPKAMSPPAIPKPIAPKQLSPEPIVNQLPPQVPKSDLTPPIKTANSAKTRTVKKVPKKAVGETTKVRKVKRSMSTSSAESELSSQSNEPESPIDNSNSLENKAPKPLMKLKSKCSLLKKSGSKTDTSSSEVAAKPKAASRSNSSSTESNLTVSSDSSSDDDDKVVKKDKVVSNGIKQNGSSRTSCLASSADEVSLSLDNKPPMTPRSQKSENQPRTDEAKSFLMRALAPVASLFKMHYQDSDKGHWLDSTGESDQNTSNNVQSLPSDDKTKINNVRHVESGNRDWWLDSASDKNSEGNVKRSHSRSFNKTSDSDPSKESNGFKFKLIKQESGEKAWWLQSNANIPEGIEILPPSRKGSSDSEKSEKFDVYKIRQVASGEKDKWLASEESVPSSNVKTNPNNGEDNFILNVVRIRHIESGEKAWWLSSNKNIPEGVHYSSASSSDESSDDERIPTDEIAAVDSENIVTGKYSVPLVLDDDDEPLGDRKSPEGLETPHSDEELNRRSYPYDNRSFAQVSSRVLKVNQRNKCFPNYISRHVDIDDVLGSSGQLFSPMMERLLARKTGQDDGDSSECEEIDPTQVRIHDSTAQRPVIQKIGSRSDIIDCSNENDNLEVSVEKEQAVELKLTRQEMTCRVRFVNDTDPFRCWSETTVPGKVTLHTFSTLLPLTCQLPALHRLLGAPQRLDDSALQVYKDGDYGPYLDLESSLSEQQEELEGFLDNRKNSIVLRTQLPVRVSAIIEKLLNTEGRELRRALFSLKQILQEDKDLVHEFVQNDGLDCLIRVGAGADQNYQNYILRALGQVMLYVDGMNGVMKHSPSLQWLYTLIASDYRLVVKTTLKLLLVFVEYVDTNCLLLIQAITEVDTTQGLPQWSNVINLLKDYKASDTELLIYAMTLINKCLNGISDPDTYYKQTDSLREQGIYDIIKRYISCPTIDLDLKRQLQIYEAAMNHKIIDNRDKRPLEESLRNADDDSGSETKLNRPTKCLSLHLVNGNSNYSASSRYSDESPTKEDAKTSPTPIRSSSDVFRENIAASLQRRRERMQRQRELIKEQQALASKITIKSHEENDVLSEENIMDNHVLFLKKQNTVKDLVGKLSTPAAAKPILDENNVNIISKAMKGLSNNQIKESRSTTDIKTEVKRNNEIEWLNIAKALNRPLIFNSYDFSDLTEDEDDELPSGMEENVIPPPPPPFLLAAMNANIPPPPMCPSAPDSESTVAVPNQSKTKKTIKLFWREITQGTKIPNTTIWDELGKVKVDESSLEVLFETRTKEIIKKQLEANKNREVIVLDHKRSNAVNILLKKLPPTQSIKNAIVNMDSSVLTREGIDKLLAMLPKKEEILKIQEAQVINPSTPLGKAEQFLLTLSSIYELNARLKLWAFRLDFECFQNEILEAYIDMKQAIEILKINVTFKKILACILSIGVFLNGSEAKGFQIEYLSKIQEVKDTVHKHSLLHHLCHMVLDQFPDTSDLYSEIGAVTRSSKINYEELSANVDRLETECKNHMGNFKIILKHDSTAIKTKVGDFLHDCAERIIILGLIKRRLFYRFSKFLLWLGVPSHHISETRPSDVFKIISEFALEYRTTRQQLQQQRQRKASHRERSKTRGKMIELNQIHINDTAENELTNILNTENFGKVSSNALGRKRKDPEFIRIEKLDRSNNQEDGIEEVFNILLEKSRTRKKERPSKNSQKLQNRSKNPVHHRTLTFIPQIPAGHVQ